MNTVDQDKNEYYVKETHRVVYMEYLHLLYTIFVRNVRVGHIESLHTIYRP